MGSAPTAKVVAARMRRLRLERGWSAQQLADKCADAGLYSLTRSTIAKIESGSRQTITAEEVAVIADVFGVSVEDLLKPDADAKEASRERDTQSIRPFRPTERNQELGVLLREMRRRAQLSQIDAAGRLEQSQAVISRMETGTRAVSSLELEELLSLYTPSPELRNEIARLTALDMPTQGAHPQRYSEDTSSRQLDSGLRRLVELEPQAVEILSFHSERIPLQLQADQYTLVQYESTGVTFDREEVLREKRIREDTVIAEKSPPYRAILSESSLLRMPGGNQNIAREQARHLLQLVEGYPRLSVQILRFDAPIAYVETDMTLLKFAGERKNVVYLPYGISGRLLKERWIVNEREEYWRSVQRAALSEEETRKFLNEMTR